MNLILLEPHEVEPDGRAVLTGRRAQHIKKVLRSRPGDQLRVGVVNGQTGIGELVEIGSDRATLAVTLSGLEEPRGDDTLILAIARPKVLLRCLEHAAALGFGKIALLRTSRVEKSHLLASSLEAETIARRLRLGLEQARRTQVPEVTVHSRFQRFLAEELAGVATPGNRFVAHPDAQRATWSERLEPSPLTLVIGPEGGLLDFEVQALEDRGFRSVHVGTTPLRVETALSFVLGHLEALRGLARDRAAT